MTQTMGTQAGRIANSTFLLLLILAVFCSWAQAQSHSFDEDLYWSGDTEIEDSFSETAATPPRNDFEAAEEEEEPAEAVPEYRKAQFRKIIAVSRFENRTTAAGQINLGSGMSDQLTNALVQSDNFIVLERQGLSDVLREQDFARSGRAAQSTVARTGQAISAQILIKGTVTEFAENESGGGAGISFKGFTVGTESVESHVALILRIIDTTTGQVLDSVRLEGKAKGSGYKFGVAYMGFGFDAEKFKNTALSKSVQIVIDNAVEMISRNLNELPFEGKIVKVKDDTYYTNIGSRNKVSGGDVFDVYSPEDVLIDPDTGENLGSLRKKVGTVVISMPQEKYSKAFASQGQAFKKGYVLRERPQDRDFAENF